MESGGELLILEDIGKLEFLVELMIYWKGFIRGYYWKAVIVSITGLGPSLVLKYFKPWHGFLAGNKNQTHHDDKHS